MYEFRGQPQAPGRERPAHRSQRPAFAKLDKTYSYITRVKNIRDGLRHRADYDELTGLANRTYLRETLRQALEYARMSGEKCALLFVDLDHFKQINDTYGHHTGDRVLREVAARLEGTVRESDMVARLGGDEFTVLVRHLAAAENAGKVAQKILAAVGRPFEADGLRLDLSASVGVSLFPDHGQDAETLLRVSDAAMYAAKQQGRNRVVLKT